MVGRWGETGHNAFVRGKKHLDALKTARDKPGKADQDNGLVTHYMDCHMGEDPQFKMDVVEQFRKPTQRQIAEGVNIHQSLDTVSMNNKNEWIQPATSRLRVSRQVRGGEERLPG